MQNIKNRLAQNPRLWLLIAAAAGLAVALPVRIWQQLFLVEDYTGFWFDSGHPSIIVLYVFMALPLVASLAVALLTHKAIDVDLTRRTRKTEGYVSLVAALCVLISCVLALLQAFAADTPGAAMFFAVLLEGIAGLGVVVFFVNLGLVNLFPASNIYLNRVLTLMPLLWGIGRLLGHFSRTISYLRVSDLFINIMSMVLLLIFFMAAAQVMSGVNAEKKLWRLMTVGLPAAVLLLLAFLPRMVATPITNVLPAQDAVLNLADLGVAVFIGVFMLTRICAKAQEDETVEEATDEIAEATDETPTETQPTEDSAIEESSEATNEPAPEESQPADEPQPEETPAAAEAPRFEEQVSIEEV